jgi:hypothetical protein
VQPLAAPLEPLAEDVVALDGLEQLELRVASAQRESHRELARLAVHVEAVHVVRPVLDEEPFAGSEQGVVVRDRFLQVAHHDADLKRAA